jgi:hypothetical protein
VDANFTNRALFACQADGVPVGVIVQTRRKPRAAYRIQGLARVAGFADGYFRLESFSFRGSAQPDAPATPPTSLEDARQRIERAIVARQGSGSFRAQALSAFGGRCAISDYDVEAALEAAHIVPYLGPHTNSAANTLLLRADLHTLFDRQMLDIDPLDLKVRIAPELQTSAYANLQNWPIRLPKGVAAHDVCANLRLRRQHLASGPS